jgi:hypothetical protein
VKLGSRLLKSSLLALALALIVPVTALGGLSSDVKKGQRLAESIRSGQKQCSDLSADDFELIGEYAMGRFLGSPTAHAAMNRHMSLMMGKAGEERMHMALGYRYSGCPGGPASGWVGPMGGMMSGRHGAGSGNFGSGMMGGYRGGMMGSGAADDDSGVGIVGVVVIALAAAALGGGLVLVAQRSRN